MADEVAPTEPVAEPAPVSEEERRRRRRRLTWLLTPIVAFSVAGMIVNASAPATIDSRPLVVIFFVPAIRWLALAVDSVDPVAFFAVAFFRLVVLDPIYYLLGYWHGEAALKWMEDKSGNTGLIPTIKRGFARFGHVIVFAMPNAYVCLLAGASQMSPRVFFPLNIGGTVVRLILIKQTADLFDSPLDSVKGFMQDYQWWLVGLSVVLLGVQVVTNRKKGELQSVSSLERDLEAEIDAASESEPE